MAIDKIRWFDRWARKQNLSTRSLCEAVREMEAGLYEADLVTAQSAGELMEVNGDAQD